MNYLKEKKHRYAAKLLSLGMVGNVYSALNQAENDLHGTGRPIRFADYELYYIVHSEQWQYPYIVKKMNSINNEPHVFEDEEIKRYRW